MPPAARPGAAERATLIFGDSAATPTDIGLVDAFEPVMAPLLERIAAGGGALARSGFNLRAFVADVLRGDVARGRGLFAAAMTHELNDYIEAPRVGRRDRRRRAAARAQRRARRGQGITTTTEGRESGSPAPVRTGVACPTSALEVGQGGTVWLDVQLPRGAAVPRALVHGLSVRATLPDAQTRTFTFDTRPTRVARRTAPALAPPLHGGPFLNFNGCCGQSPHRTAIVALDGTAYLSERYASDFIRLDARGAGGAGDLSRNESFFTFGEPVFAVGDARVVSIRNDQAENVPLNEPPRRRVHRADHHGQPRRAPTRRRALRRLRPPEVRQRAGSPGAARAQRRGARPRRQHRPVRRRAPALPAQRRARRHRVRRRPVHAPPLLDDRRRRQHRGVPHRRRERRHPPPRRPPRCAAGSSRSRARSCASPAEAPPHPGARPPAICIIHGMPWPGFAEERLVVGEASYFLVRGGAGPPVLLLHGFPQTHVCWRGIAPRLAETCTVVAPDLRGYGASEAPAGGPRGEGHSKRETALEFVELMHALGHDRFAVVGHDRGARVAYRLALDHGERVTRAAVLNVVPTLEQFERMGAGPSLGFWPWFLLAQPAPFPERMIAADPAALLEHVFATWASRPAAVDPASREAYVRALTPSTIAAMCADYRASFHLDRLHDAEDRAAGRRIAAPLLVVTGEDEEQLADADDVWRAWADDVTARRVPGGHFVPEEAPDQVATILVGFLGADPRG